MQAAADAAKALPEPGAIRPAEEGPASAPADRGDGDRTPASRSARAARDADRIAAEEYQAAVDDGRVSEAEQAKLDEVLQKIDQEADARAALIREGAVCLTAGFGLGAVS